MPDPAAVRTMFSRIARRYDRANRLLSLGIDVRWRRAALRWAELRPGESVLDSCAGTGDVALAMAGAGAEVVGCDFCVPMLRHAVDKGQATPSATWVAGDALDLPFPDDTFDLATVAFGIRNVADPVAGLREMARVVRPGGRVVVLEFSRPHVPVLGSLYRFYFRRILPRLGSWISGDDHGAYRYLQDSAMRFPEREEFLALMDRAGLDSPRYRPLTLGIACLYRAEVPTRGSCPA